MPSRFCPIWPCGVPSFAAAGDPGLIWTRRSGLCLPPEEKTPRMAAGGGMKMRIAHAVPLPTQAVKLLRELHLLTGTGELCFPGRHSASQCISDMALLNGIRRMGFSKEAARLANAQLVLPQFTSVNGTDFNDLHQIESIEVVRSQLESALTKQHGLVALDMSEFLSMQIPDRGYLYAPRGVGKTFAALSVAVAVASGGAVFNCRAPMPKKTLYVDGEMPATSMQSRLSSLVGGMAIPPQALKNLSLITPDLQPCAMPDLSTAGSQCPQYAQPDATGAGLSG